MDEILIGEKKYVSSKQAAKMTGYAKDYIGQLCREGRVPARLVGRSWYVLESAIHDHRFGEQKTESKPDTSTWEPPRYEAKEHDEFPEIQELIKEERSSKAGDQEDSLAIGQTEEVAAEVTEKLEDAWKAWFNRVEESPKEEVMSETPRTEGRIEQEEINVPFTAVYTEPPIELLPRKGGKQAREEALEEDSVAIMTPHKRPVFTVIRVFGFAIAIICVAVAVMGSGYIDKYIASYSQVSSVSGVILYDK